MSPGLNPRNALIFRASLFRRISIIISLSMFLFDFVLSFGANPKFDDCQPQNCGSGPNISYPFWIPNVQQPNCGIPGFDIECDNSRPICRTFGSCYAIKEISYDENSFRVVNEAVLNAGCPLPSLNYSFERLRVTFGPDHADLCIFRNCDGSFSVNSTISWAECGPGDGNKSFAAIASMCDHLNWNRASCQYLVAAPVQVQNWKVNQSVEYLKLLEDGFTLNWTGYNCTRCRRSGGRRGSQNTASVCYWPDRTDLVHCGDGKAPQTILI
ncbi:LEAF RUST 10 DISEASE-RESISTANCE LOCUS RECEPTOR-LIKE PROTEIN KINASE-like 1.2 [Syzygium oleosum]|uniref:LEAF RUST 10 DISEASE-RESISTANCE LOCUS RECEPTOR-LIKE PROTEIN KINASE-like 1.2 n=1 Tax=Syzygium oleosum TaxID=219896 RepID=UPI0011D1DF32|nr:LEAF RUST 10 DISEASE-RESISTANCE LOCUS RECEPTOR-LIKE PROTEIN KINASE-like 1.2 [Syzygium oleosum]